MFWVACGFDNWSGSRSGSRPEVNQLTHWVIHKQYKIHLPNFIQICSQLSELCWWQVINVLLLAEALIRNRDIFTTVLKLLVPWFVRSVINCEAGRHCRVLDSQWAAKRLEDGVQKESQGPSYDPAPTQHTCRSTHPPTHPHTTGLCRKTTAAYLL